MASNFWESPHALELVPRAIVLSAHARERSLGLGDGDIEAYKAFVVEYMTEVARHSSGALRQRVASSAAAYARRHLLRRGLAAMPPVPLALACLFLAAKVEESHVSVRYLLRCAERAAESCFSSRSGQGAAAKEEMKKGGGGGGSGGGGGGGSIRLVASSSSAFQRDRNNHAAAPSSSLKKPAAAAAAEAAAAEAANSSCPLPLPTPRQLLEAEAELVSSLGARGLLIWSPYPDALEAAAAIEEEREKQNQKQESSKRQQRPSQQQPLQQQQQQQRQRQRRLGARAWAAVSVSFARSDVCLWAPPHVIGFAAAAVAAAAADEAERMAAEEEEGGAGDGGDGAGGGQRARRPSSSSSSPPPCSSSSSSSPRSFTAAATRWFSSLDVDLDSVAEVAAELCYAAGVERAAAKATGAARGAAGTRGENDGNGGSGGGGGGGGSAPQRADAAARVFEFLRSFGR